MIINLLKLVDNIISKIKENIDYSIVLMIIIIGLMVEILHAFGVIGELSPTGILVYISILISLSLVLIIRKVDELKETVNASLEKSGSFLLLDGYEEFYKRAEEEAKKAEKSIDVTNFYPISPTAIQTEAVSGYYKTIAKIIQENSNLTFRRIASINSLEKLAWVKHTISSLSEENFHIKYASSLCDDDFPIINILIFDRTKVIIGMYSEVPALEKGIFIENPTAAVVFSDYFNTIWDKSIKLKMGAKVTEKTLQDIEEKIKAKNTLTKPTPTQNNRP
jgi:hypothetical protein